MTFLEVLPATLDGQSIRCRAWTGELYLRWNWDRCRWQASCCPGPVFHWVDLEAMNGMLTPTEMLRTDWEVVS